MPELPEVEHVRRGVETLIGIPIENVRVGRRDVVRDEHAKRRGRLDHRLLLEGATVTGTRRHGKQLALIGSNGACVLVHLGMSGQLLVLDTGQRVSGGHAHVVWSLGDGRRLVFRDPRRFGGVWLLRRESDLDARWASLGNDGLVITGGALCEALGASTRAVKAGLLDQSAVAGVGNIYADEALFDAGINPGRPCNMLTEPEWDRLSVSVRAVLEEGFRRGGSTLRDYRRPDGSSGDAVAGHRVYGRGSKPCFRCENKLSQAQIAQRTTVWCPRCQRVPPP